jgi:hypothetical protein
MGRGLSELQRNILAMARDNRIAESLAPVAYEVLFTGPDYDPDRWWSDEIVAWRETIARIGYADTGEAARLDHERMLPGKPFLGCIHVKNSKPFWGIYPSAIEDRTEAMRIAEAGIAAGIKAYARIDISSCWAAEPGRPWCGVYKADLYSWEVLDRVYGFGEHPFRCRGHDGIDRSVRGRHLGCIHRFDRKAVGIARYEAARISVLKSFQALNNRGLAVSISNSSPALKVTNDGMKVAEGLSVTVPSIVSNRSQ